MTSKFIEELKEQHRSIIDEFNILLSLLMKEENKSILKQLKKIKSKILKHLKLENKKLYPQLLKIVGDVSKTAGSFYNEMERIGKKAMEFFDSYTTKAEESKQFRNETKDIISIITRRINIEEDVLFPLYEKYYVR